MTPVEIKRLQRLQAMLVEPFDAACFRDLLRAESTQEADDHDGCATGRDH